VRHGIINTLAFSPDGQWIALSPVGTRTVNKAGNGTLVLSGANTYSGGTTIAAGTVSINANNNLGASGTANFGGGIYNYGIHGNATLTMNNSTISGNQSFQGGGLFNDGGVTDSIAVVTISNSTFSGNYADQYAGGIMNAGNEGGQATVIVTNTTFAENSSCNCNFFAGAIFNDGNTQPGGAMLEMGNTIFKGGLVDISIGGLGVMLQGRNNERPKVLLNERLRSLLVATEQFCERPAVGNDGCPDIRPVIKHFEHVNKRNAIKGRA
jgi:autotransporter-associated beta strand protein